MMEMDETSLLVTTDTDHTVREIEEELGRRGYTLNYHAIPHNDLLLVDILNERTPNVYRCAYGGIEDLCLQIQLAQTDSTLYTNVLAPRTATGPSLKKIAVGSGETLGIPVQATLKMFHKPAATEVACILFSNRRQLDFFVQSVIRHRIPLPLLCPLPPATAKKYFEGYDRNASILSLAFWGEEASVGRYSAYLRDLASRKHGDWISAQKSKVKNELLEAIRHEAIQSTLRELRTVERAMSVSHRSLSKVIQDIL